MRRTLLALTLVGLLLPLGSIAAADLPPGGTFLDDDGNVHEGYIEAIAAEGITRGCNPPANDRYCPDDPVTRGEMAAFITRSLGLPGASADRFVDDDTSIFESDIEAIAAAGITRGCNPPANDRFCPDDPVTRAEMAAFLRRAYDYPDAGGDRFVDDNGSIFESDIEAIANVGVTRGCNPPANDRFCPDDPVLRDQMASFLGRAEGLTPIIPPPRPPLLLRTVVSGLASPVQAIPEPGSDRLFIVEKSGLIRIVEGGTVRPTPFLDIRGPVIDAGERGLLSMTFHPDYPTDPRFFVWYSGSLQSGGTGNHTTYLSEFRRSSDPDRASTTEQILLAIDQPFTNHNGGLVGFGPDGLLYLSTGDGGSSNDPLENARDIGSLLGKILRIDVDSGNPYVTPSDNPYVGRPGRDEIWAIGLRNPWRWSIDGERMYIGDVGQNSREEINAEPTTEAGLDYGWSRYEGSVCNPNDSDPLCSTSGLTFPVLEYGRGIGASVTGGVVYRGSAVPDLVGHYVYGDFVSGILRSFRLSGGAATEARDLADDVGAVPGVVHIGPDGSGELLIVTIGGTVYRLEPST